MSRAWLKSVVIWLAGAGLASAQTAPPYFPAASEPGRATVEHQTTPHELPAPAIHPMPGPGPMMPPPAFPAPASLPMAYNNAFHTVTPPPTDNAFDPLGQLCRPCYGWFSAEYLFWWVKDEATAPLVAGPGFQFSNDGLDNNEHAGVRLTGGVVLSCGCLQDVEASAFYLGEHSPTRTFTSNAGGSPVLVRPFVNAQTGLPAFVAVSVPGVLAGAAQVSSSRNLYGGEANLILGPSQSPVSHRAVGLLGLRYVNFEEELDVVVARTSLVNNAIAFRGAALPAGSRQTITDSFSTRNQFYGGQVGIRGEFELEYFFVTVAGKVAVGNNHQTLDVFGQTLSQAPGAAVATASGGLLAAGSNGGRRTQNELSFIPEFQLTVGCHLGPCVSLFLGYDLLLWTNVLRPGSELDPVVNPNQIPTSTAFGTAGGPARPAVRLDDRELWIQGFSGGFAIRY